MKKNRIIFLIILILITCTGCSVEYNINITKNNIEETINVVDNITETRTKTDILNNYQKWYPTFVNFISKGESIEVENFDKKVDGVKYHDKTISENNNGYNYTYKYTYPIEEYYDSYILASVFPETQIYKGYDKLVIRTSKENFLCSYDYFDSAKVNITIDPEVYELNHTNTNNKNNNTYTWIIDKENCSNDEIILTLNIKNENLINFEGFKNNDNNNQIEESFFTKYGMYVFCGVLIILILIGYGCFKKLKNKNNINEDD